MGFEDLIQFLDEFTKKLITDKNFYDAQYLTNEKLTKKKATKDFRELLGISKEIRTISYNLLITLIHPPDFENFPKYLWVVNSLINGMIMTSKIVEDLALAGMYIQADTILRSNFEKFLILDKFTSTNKIDLFEKHFPMTMENKKYWGSFNQMEADFWKRQSLQDSQHNPELYSYFSKHAHPHISKIEAIEIRGVYKVGQKYGFAFRYPIGSEYHFEKTKEILASNDLMLIDTFILIYKYLSNNKLTILSRYENQNNIPEGYRTTYNEVQTGINLLDLNKSKIRKMINK